MYPHQVAQGTILEIESLIENDLEHNTLFDLTQQLKMMGAHESFFDLQPNYNKPVIIYLFGEPSRRG